MVSFFFLKEKKTVSVRGIFVLLLPPHFFFFFEPTSPPSTHSRRLRSRPLNTPSEPPLHNPRAAAVSPFEQPSRRRLRSASLSPVAPTALQRRCAPPPFVAHLSSSLPLSNRGGCFELGDNPVVPCFST